jgi:hypothetical protein
MTLADDPILQQQRAVKAVLWTGVFLVLMSLPMLGLEGARSVALGAAIGGLNLWVLARSVRAFLTQQGAFPWGIFVMLKLLVISGGLYLLFQAALVQGLPLMLGLGALPIGILVAQLAQPTSLQATRVETKEGSSARSQ